MELTISHLDRIRRLDPKLNAFLLVIEERALADAQAGEARQVTGASRGKLDESHTEAFQEWHVDQSHQRQVQLRFPGKGDQHRRVKKQLRPDRGSSRRRGEARRLD